eukprot:TRINITY_DN6399_c1_g1_i1.p1 TRINITY_DN6399_c1_g1~~TRINITY_DN6399_c1_g1_i1.p1  ORF type:complete len:1181 (-),score=268.98 TRINITY_DN6399_c1_g1_i1:450-3992(-)
MWTTLRGTSSSEGQDGQQDNKQQQQQQQPLTPAATQQEEEAETSSSSSTPMNVDHADAGASETTPTAMETTPSTTSPSQPLTPTPTPTPATTPTPTPTLVASLSADELRRRRLERFNSPPLTAATPNSKSSSSPSPTQPLPTPTPTTPTTTAKSPFPATAAATAPHTTAMDIDKKRRATAPTQPVSVPIATHTRSTPPRESVLATSPTNLSMSPTNLLATHEGWENAVVSRIFQVTLVPNKQGSKSSDHFYLSTLSQELEADETGKLQEHAVPLLSAGLLERILFERLSATTVANKDHVGYLVSCYTRQQIENNNGANKKSPMRMSALKFCQELILNYTVLVLLYPEDWPQNVRVGVYEEMGRQVLACLEADTAASASAMTPDFLENLLKLMNEEQVQQAFTPVLDELSYKMKSMNLLGLFVPAYRALAALTRHKPIANMLASLPTWIPPNATGREIESNSFLGPFFRLSCLPTDPSVGAHYFASPGVMSTNNINTALGSVRTALTTSQRLCYDILKAMLTAGGKAKDAVLDWIGAVLQQNISRTRMHGDRRKASSDAFCLNLAVVLLELCGPFLDPAANKMHLIEPSYFISTKRLGDKISTETRLAATSEDVKSHMDTHEDSKQHNFVTECFFLTLQCLHVTLPNIYELYHGINKAVAEKLRARDALRSTRDRWTDDAPANEALLQQVEAQLEEYTRDKLCYEAQVTEPSFILKSHRYYLLLAAWLSKIVDPESKGLPLAPATFEYASLPEYVVEDLADYHIRRPHKIEMAAGLEHLMTFLVLFLGSPTHVKNPYLRAKLVEVLYAFTPKELGTNLGAFEGNPIVTRFLSPVLMTFYVDIEFAERAHNFYEKFNTRYYVAAVMRHIWQIPDHKKTIEATVASDEVMFLKFVNMLLNDSTYLLDESLNKLMELHNIEVAMAAPTWRTTDAATREEAQSNHQRIERQVGTYMLLGNETMDMIHYLTKDLPHAFLRPELMDRLAAMLGDLLAQLAGPKCANLRVSNPEKYHFKPRELLTKLVDIYTHLSYSSHTQQQSDVFAAAIARDGRSYSDDLFQRVVQLLRREGLRPEEVIQRFELVATKARESGAKDKDIESMIGDIPDEFTDPIMGTLMQDPVILPSGTTVDRAVICRHLLSDNKDPFNRRPLDVSMLKPDDALRAKIVAWLAAKGITLASISRTT